MIEVVSLFGGEGCVSFWANLGFPLKADFLVLVIACNDAMDTIYRTLVISEILTTLNGLSMYYIPDIPLRLFLLLGGYYMFGGE